jgi:hypothetical protein
MGAWLPSAEVGLGTSVLGPIATFSALSAAEMRFFKTHGFVKPLLREMLFRVGVSCFVLGPRAHAATESDADRDQDADSFCRRDEKLMNFKEHPQVSRKGILK